MRRLNPNSSLGFFLREQQANSRHNDLNRSFLGWQASWLLLSQDQGSELAQHALRAARHFRPYPDGNDECILRAAPVETMLRNTHQQVAQKQTRAISWS